MKGNSKAIQKGSSRKPLVLNPFLSEVSEAFTRLNWSQKLVFMQTCVNEFQTNKRMMKKAFLMWYRAMYPRSYRKPELWIETRLKKDMSLKPRYVAYECASYLKISKVMIPHLIRVAQRVKQKLRMCEKVRQWESSKQSLKQSSKQSLKQSLEQSSGQTLILAVGSSNGR